MDTFLLASGGGDYVPVIITAITTIAILFFSIFAKTIYSIFQAGVNFKSNFALIEDVAKLRAEFTTYREELKSDLRAWKEEIERVVLQSAKSMIERDLQHVTKMGDKLDSFNETYITFKANIDYMSKKINNITTIEDEIVNVKSRLTKLEYDDDGNNIRRSIK